MKGGTQKTFRTHQVRPLDVCSSRGGIESILMLLKSFASEYNINIFVVHHAIMNEDVFDDYEVLHTGIGKVNAAYALTRRGIGQLTIANRTLEKAEVLVKQIQSEFNFSNVEVVAGDGVATTLASASLLAQRRRPILGFSCSFLTSRSRASR